MLEVDPVPTAEGGTRVMGERSLRPGLDKAEVVALGLTVVAIVGFGVYGFATRAPSTASYLFTVSAVAALIVRFRKARISRPLTIGLALLAIVHLAGGLIRVGDDVLYNASVGTDAFEYDHFVHASGVFLGILLLWTFFMPSVVDPAHRRGLIAACVLAGLGLGALNETIEFLTTLAHDGAHVGGYRNTGWDLVSNLVGGMAAGLWVSKHQGVVRTRERRRLSE